MSFSDAFALVGWLSRVRRVRVAGKVCRADGACKLRLIIHTYAFMGWWGLGFGVWRFASGSKRARACVIDECVCVCGGRTIKTTYEQHHCGNRSIPRR